jgi:2,3-bisphosphoglycerate-dependent phosphoglycerate mutase
MSNSSTLILICSGESIWDEEKKIAGWTDVPLSELGVNQCKEAAYLLRGTKIDIAFTSVLKRAIHTTCILLDEIDQNSVKIKKHWRLNPRHYGTMQGVTWEDAKKHEHFLNIWKGATEKFQCLSLDDETHPSHDLRYSLVPSKFLPCSESLFDMQGRVLPYFFDKIAPCLLKGKTVLVVTHENTVRALRLHFKDYETGIEDLEIARGVARIYTFNEKLDIVDRKNLGNTEDIEQRIRKLIVE